MLVGHVVESARRRLVVSVGDDVLQVVVETDTSLPPTPHMGPGWAERSGRSGEVLRREF